MGERKGQNKYYPPDFFRSSKVMSKGLDAYHGHHTLRERGKKAHLGILVIRFEMPYNIWCDGCKNHIGMGVRYNAEKQKVGNYYSTPIYEFKMKCHLCDNYFVIKTDPANLDYEIVSGARRQENRWDPTQNGQIVPETKEVQRKLFDDAMFKLEHGVKDQKNADDGKPVISKLFKRNDELWKDNFEVNMKMRAAFRKTKKDMKAKEDADNRILSRASLIGSVKLLDETDEDRQLASLMKLHSTRNAEERTREKMKKIMEKPALPSSSSSTVTSLNIKKKEKHANEIGIAKKSLIGVKRKLDGKPVSLVSAYSSSSDEN